MKKLVRPNGEIKPVGTVTEIGYQTKTQYTKGETVEITDLDNNTLNIAQVLETEPAKFVMIA